VEIYDFNLTTLDGKPYPLANCRNQVMLIVNVASHCGFTPQYAGLETLYRSYRDQGFSVLGFPCNQFGHQEPGDENEIQQFCSLTYNVSFPLFAKIEVNGAGTHPLYALLKKAQKGWLGTQSIKWNFTKFLVGRDGSVMKRYSPRVTPESIRQDIEKLLTPDTTAPVSR